MQQQLSASNQPIPKGVAPFGWETGNLQDVFKPFEQPGKALEKADVLVLEPPQPQHITNYLPSLSSQKHQPSQHFVQLRYLAQRRFPCSVECFPCFRNLLSILQTICGIEEG